MGRKDQVVDKKAKGQDVAAKPRAKRMSPEARRQQILMCALDIFAERGIMNSTHAEISDRAQVASPTVFHYFPTIVDLQTAVLMEVRRFLLDEFVVSRMSVDMPAYERVEEMLLAFREAVDQHRNYIAIWLEWSGFTRDFIWDLYLEFYRDVVAAIRRLLLEGRRDNSISSNIVATDAARIILGMAHTIAHMRFAGSSERTVQQTIHSLIMSYIAPDKAS